MRFTVIGSGSTGNAVLISSGSTNVLVDAGLSARELLRRLAVIGLQPEDLDAVLITHEHSDHAGGLRVLMRSLGCPVFMSGATEEAFYSSRRADKNGNGEGLKRRDALAGKTVQITSDTEFRIGNIDFLPFSVPHDAADNFGFVAKSNGVKIGTLMDVGHMTELVKTSVQGCDALVIESNHSRDMLRACHLYSWDLKQRIASNTGHLSNEELADWLTTEFDGSARHIVLAHLSQRANEPHLAKLTAETAILLRSPLFRAETSVTISHPKQPTDWITLG